MIDINTLLNECKIIQGMSVNGRFYQYNGKTILEHNVRTKNVWVQNEIRNYIPYNDDTIEKLIVQWFNGDAKKALFSDNTQIINDLRSSFEKSVNKYINTTGKIPDLAKLKSIFPGAVSDILEDVIKKKVV